MRGRLGLIASTTALAAGVSVPATAQAAVSCSFAADTVTLTLTGSDTAAVSRSGDNIVVNNGSVTCAGGPTINNVNTVVANGDAFQQRLLIDLSSGQFAPGASDEGSSSEIEWRVDLVADPTTDRVHLTDSSVPEPQDVEFGTGGINLNRGQEASEGGDDADVTNTAGTSAPAGVEEYVAGFMGGGPHALTGLGGTGTGSATTIPIDATGGGANDVFTGGNGHDQLYGEGGNDVLTGRAGFNTFSGGPGNDTLDGATGDDDTVDTGVYIGDNGTGVRVDLSVDGPQNTVGEGIDTLPGIERLSGSQFDDELTGDGGPNLLFGDSGNDVIRGGLGNDFLVPKHNGTPGDPGDTIAFDKVAGATSGVNVDLATPSVVATGGQGADSTNAPVPSFNRVIGSPLADTIEGNSNANRLLGAAGADSILGGGGDDLLDGGGDNDTASAGTGNDSATGGAGTDRVAGESGNDTVDGGSQNDVVDGGTENDTARGGRGADLVLGGSGIDLVFGDAGRDRMLGQGGIDRLFAKDRTRDRRINCGRGSNRREKARYDRRGKRRKRDPRPISC